MTARPDDPALPPRPTRAVPGRALAALALAASLLAVPARAQADDPQGPPAPAQAPVPASASADEPAPAPTGPAPGAALDDPELGALPYLDPDDDGLIDTPTDDGALLSLLRARDAREAEIEKTRTRALASEDPNERARLLQIAQDLQREMDGLTRKFESLSSGVDVDEVEEPTDRPLDLQTELESLLRPLIRQLTDASEGPREIERLRTEEAVWTQRLELADHAIAQLSARLDAGVEPGLRPGLLEALDAWRGRRADFRRSKQVAAFELQQRMDARKSLIDSASGFVSGFFQTKGLNLMLAIAAFVLVLVTLRLLGQKVVDPLRSRQRLSFYGRLLGVIFQIFAVVVALGAMILTLFSVSDWVLLVLLLIFLLGIGWASANMLPRFFEQVRVLLNLGSVREGERVIFRDLPWLVKSLKLYTELVNPRLTGGRLRIPVNDLIGLHSRPLGHDETWFPCSEGHWVLLADGTRGRVDSQTPDLVHLQLPGGGEKTYLTPDFLAQTPRNLSTGYRARIVFGIDYAHQPICTTEVPPIMKAKLEQGLLGLLDASQIRKVTVEFKEAGASSLDYEIQVDVDGSADARYEDLHRAMARLLVDACNENDWVIPFTQITVHGAA